MIHSAKFALNLSTLPFPWHVWTFQDIILNKLNHNKNREHFSSSGTSNNFWDTKKKIWDTRETKITCIQLGNHSLCPWAEPNPVHSCDVCPIATFWYMHSHTSMDVWSLVHMWWRSISPSCHIHVLHFFAADFWFTYETKLTYFSNVV